MDTWEMLRQHPAVQPLICVRNVCEVYCLNHYTARSAWQHWQFKAIEQTSKQWATVGTLSHRTTPPLCEIPEAVHQHCRGKTEQQNLEWTKLTLTRISTFTELSAPSGSRLPPAHGWEYMQTHTFWEEYRHIISSCMLTSTARNIYVGSFRDYCCLPTTHLAVRKG